MTRPDFVIIGSGINALTCGAMLAKGGRKVLLLERNGVPGGCIVTDAVTAPGFVHDVLATTFVLWVTGAAHGALAPDLARHGVEFLASDTPTGVLRPDGSALVLKMDRAANVAALDAAAPGDGARFAADMDRMGADAGLLFGLMGGEVWSPATAKLLGREAWKRGSRPLAATLGAALEPMRGWLETTYDSDLVHALWAPWCLHAGLGPEASFSGQMGRIIGFALEMAGAPVIKGGAFRLVEALAAIIRENGGDIRTGANVARVLTEGGRATGVRLADGETIAAGGVIASTTPHQLYGPLLGNPPEREEPLRRYRYGKGNFQLHYALKHPPRWTTPGLDRVQLLHLTPGLDGVSRAGNECERGLLPAVPTICVGQPSAVDPSRAPDGQAALWLQMPEAPRVVKGDAAGQIDIPADGRWSEALRTAYADRIEAILATHIEGFRDSVIARHAVSPGDLEEMNVNLVGGDPYGGACSIDQFFLWRPFADTKRHETGVRNLWHIGASTHPGPGLSGGSGFLVANGILK